MNDYEKKLEEHIEHLTKLLEKRYGHTCVYIVVPKQYIHFSNEHKSVFITLAEAIVGMCNFQPRKCVLMLTK
jgi:hypothetical protein